MKMCLARQFLQLTRAAIIVSAILPVPVSAEVVRFEMGSVDSFANGVKFGDTGSYERIVGRVHFAIDPELRQNRAIVDLDLAERNPARRVEFSADLFILVPRDRTKANGAILHEVNNRGNKLVLSQFNGAGGNDPKTAKDAGDGFLLRNGFTIVGNGWDGELLPGNNRLRLQAPVANRGGRVITGKVRCEIVPTRLVKRIDVNWANHGSYRPVVGGLSTATLTVREYPSHPRKVL